MLNHDTLAIDFGSTVRIAPTAEQIATTIQPADDFTPSDGDAEPVSGAWNSNKAAMIKMCGLSSCTGISIEHLIIDGGSALTTPQNNNGIYNAAAGDQSYVNDVTFKNVNYNGLFIGSNTTVGGSGPYSNINVNVYTGTGSSGKCTGTGATTVCPACAVLLASTRGLHGLTCIGTSSTATLGSGAPDPAGVYVVAGNTSVNDVHVESFVDGVQIYAGNGALGNVGVTNVTGGK